MEIKATCENEIITCFVKCKKEERCFELSIDASKFDAFLLESGICQDRINRMWEMHNIGFDADLITMLKKYVKHFLTQIKHFTK